MIVCMNIGTDGERYIAYIEYHYHRSDVVTEEIADHYKRYYDEVYVVGFDNNYKRFITETVLRGCRV